MMLRNYVLPWFACSLLPAQDAAEPAPPQVVLETVGPDGWRARLGPTNLGALLASEGGRALWQPAVEPVLGMWAAIAGGPDAYRETSERLLGYGGSVRFAWRRSSDGMVSFAVVLDGDGRTDPAALAADLRRLVEVAAPGEWTKKVVAGREIEARLDATMFLSAPRVDGGQVWVLGGAPQGIGDAMGLRAWLAARPATLATPKPGSPAARVKVDLAQMIDVGAGVGAGERELLEAFGLDALRNLTLTVRAAGPHVQLGADVEVAGAPRGFVRAFMPPSQGISGLAALLPKTTAATKVGRFDPLALVNAVLDLADAQIRSGREDAAEFFGVDLADDLFSHATDELLVIGEPLQDFERIREATWGLAWRLKDDVKFRAGFLAVTKKLKGFLSPSETVDVDGVELRRYGNLLGYDVWMAVGNGLWVITAGRDAEEEATALLQKAAGDQWQPIATPPIGFDGLGRHLPAGCNGFARADLASIASMPIDWWLEAIPDLLPRELRPEVDEELADQEREAILALLVENRLSDLRTATGWSDGTWRWRLFW